MKTEYNLHRWLLVFILIVATILRLYNLDYSYSNDELSALSRLNFDSLQDLIVKGVMVDFHPAFVQLFLYFWTQLFGNTEIAVRLPFVFFGVGSIWLVYLVSKEWFNRNTALATASAMAGLQFFIMYSQLARPYSPGLFFTWAAVWFWTRILKGKGSYTTALGGGVCVALAMHTHYFSFMQVMIMSGLGLIWVNKENLKYYLTAGIVAFVLWIPHLTITIHHLSKGGVGTWLGAPEQNYLWTFILFLVNDYIILILFLIIFAAGLWTNRHVWRLNRWHLISLLLFFIPFCIGFYYSRLVNPVLQYSTLIFAAPCLLMLAFSSLKKEIAGFRLIVLTLLILGSTSLSTIAITKYYSTENFGVFRELSEKLTLWEDRFGEENITNISHVNSPYYLQYYLDRINSDITFRMHDVDSDSSKVHLKNIIETSTTPYLAFAWSTHYVPLEIYEIIRREYPKMVDAEYHFNSGVYLFSKEGSDERQLLFAFDASHSDKTGMTEGFDSQKAVIDSLGWGYHLNPADEYSWSFNSPIEDLNLNGGELVVVKANVQTNREAEVTLVLEYISDLEENKKWYGNDLYPVFSNESSDIHQLVMAFEIPAEPIANDQLKSYLWKRSSDSLRIKEFSVRIYPPLRKK